MSMTTYLEFRAIASNMHLRIIPIGPGEGYAVPSPGDLASVEGETLMIRKRQFIYGSDGKQLTILLHCE